MRVLELRSGVPKGGAPFRGSSEGVPTELQSRLQGVAGPGTRDAVEQGGLGFDVSDSNEGARAVAELFVASEATKRGLTREPDLGNMHPKRIKWVLAAAHDARK